MFSGIVEEVGKILQTSDTSAGRRLKIAAQLVTQDVKLGDSISVSGTCLTVVRFDNISFEVEATFQTLRCTRLGTLKKGDAVNLERALKVSDRLGGHLVSGHVDDLGQVSNIEAEGFSRLVSFSVSPELAHFLVEKGSVAIDGVSLTVAGLKGQVFTVALIPHTLEVTTLGQMKVGDKVNVETDLVAKYLAKWAGPAIGEKLKNAGLSLPFLAEHGYT